MIQDYDSQEYTKPNQHKKAPPMSHKWLQPLNYDFDAREERRKEGKERRKEGKKERRKKKRRGKNRK